MTTRMARARAASYSAFDGQHEHPGIRMARDRPQGVGGQPIPEQADGFAGVVVPAHVGHPVRPVAPGGLGPADRVWVRRRVGVGEVGRVEPVPAQAVTVEGGQGQVGGDPDRGQDLGLPVCPRDKRSRLGVVQDALVNGTLGLVRGVQHGNDRVAERLFGARSRSSTSRADQTFGKSDKTVPIMGIRSAREG